MECGGGQENRYEDYKDIIVTEVKFIILVNFKILSVMDTRNK